jgi:pyridoxal phosphate enzyme (YggS family)
MAFLNDTYQQIQQSLVSQKVSLVAVSKTKPASDIQEAYEAGHRDFGENYVQELVDKYEALPKEIRWHFIGHLQSNKVKYIAPFVYLIHGVDSEKLLQEINKQGAKNNRRIDCLLQVYIAKEETKFGLDENELKAIYDKIQSTPEIFSHICVKGLMGMASNTTDQVVIKAEFQSLRSLYDQYAVNPTDQWQFNTLSMGMSSDYKLAIEAGSNMVRIGSLLFGERNYNQS